MHWDCLRIMKILFLIFTIKTLELKDSKVNQNF